MWLLSGESSTNYCYLTFVLKCYLIYALEAVAKFGRVLKPKAANFGKNASVEMVPPSPSEFIQHLNKLKNDVLSGRSVSRLQNSTVNEFTAKGLVVAEVAFWFYIGEMIGRRSIIGYNPKIE